MQINEFYKDIYVKLVDDLTSKATSPMGQRNTEEMKRRLDSAFLKNTMQKDESEWVPGVGGVFLAMQTALMASINCRLIANTRGLSPLIEDKEALDEKLHEQINQAMPFERFTVEDITNFLDKTVQSKLAVLAAEADRGAARA